MSKVIKEWQPLKTEIIYVENSEGLFINFISDETEPLRIKLSEVKVPLNINNITNESL